MIRLSRLSGYWSPCDRDHGNIISVAYEIQWAQHHIIMSNGNAKKIVNRIRAVRTPTDDGGVMCWVEGTWFKDGCL